jgi:hypothetical protein
MFGLFTHKTPHHNDYTTLEQRIRSAVGDVTTGSALIVLALDEEHHRRALVIHNPHGHVTVLFEPKPDSHFTDCFVVDGNDIRDDPHGMSVWPVADEHFMAQFHRTPKAVVQFFHEDDPR